MVPKADQERLKSLLKDTITLLCKNGLTFHNEFSIEAVIGITLDKDDVLLVSINEQIQSKEPVIETTSFCPKDIAQFSTAVTSTDSSPGKDGRQLKRKLGIKKNDELDNANDDNYQSEPEFTKEPLEWQGHRVKQPKYEHKNERNPEGCGVGDVIFIKKEIDINLSKQTLDGRTNSNAENNISSLVGNDLHPIADQEGSALWEQTIAFNNSKLYTSQDGSHLTPERADMSEQQNHIMDQQIWLNAGQQVSFLCRFCNKCFYNSTNLQKHENWHNGKYTSYCKVCGKGFMSVSALRGHMAIHTGVKEFKCSICGKDYAYKHALKSHIKKKHVTALHVTMETVTHVM